MKAKNERVARQWAGGSQPNADFRLFYLSGDLLSKLDDLTDFDSQADLIAELIREEHERRSATKKGGR